MLTVQGRRYDTGEPVEIRTEGNRIADVVPAWPTGPVADWPFVAPGLFDIQINGHSGIWFSSATLTPDEVARAVRPYFAHGVTRLFPTLITAGRDTLMAGFRAIRAACEREPWLDAMVAGCHLEGPYISAEDGPRGAHPREHVRPANWDEFVALQEASGGRIRLVTLAPESEGAIDFIRRATASGVVISLGHTAANGEQISAAVDAGAKLSTHLGNGAHGMIRRHPNYIWEQLGEPRLWASVISDGFHLPPTVLRSLVRAKGSNRIVLTSDAAGWAGCAPGRYELGSGKFELLPDGRIVIAGQEQLLAGSSLATDSCVANAVRVAGVSLREAVEMASTQPARLMGLEPGRLQRGGLADLCVLDWDPSRYSLSVRKTIARGAVQFES
ncbi:MAG TPA: amidohydrolase family protein [Planctomycetaceae bacterium]|nr:amidohydrolase family protein [Planctomycetaceae bacterium]